MKLILISSSEKHAEKEIVQVNKMFELGLENFHLRKPKYTTRELSQYISAIPAHFHNRIIIHSHHKLVFRYNLKGIHLTRIHRKRKLRQWFIMRRIALMKPHLLTTTSFRKLANLYEEPAKYSYVFLSPIFDSLSGKYQSGFNEFSLKAAMEKTPHRVIARGGMDPSRIEKSKEIGFAGIAFYSSIWKKDDPVAEYIRTLEQFRALGIKPE
ncbi:MAG: thiamine phosphate synthase [Bacteroidota bacterium]|jgi:thiamine-phosphate pyrophosphorylase